MMRAKLQALVCLGLLLAMMPQSQAQQPPNRRIGASGRTLWELDTGKVLLLTNTNPALWDLDSGMAIQTFPYAVAAASWVVLSPDGTLAIAASARNSDVPRPIPPTVLFNVGNGKEIRRLDPGTTPAFSPDGSRILTRDSSDTRVSNTQTGQELFRLSGVGSVVFSRNGRRMAGMVNSRRARAWDADSGKEICTVETGNVGGAVDIHPDGTLLFISFSDANARTWQADTCMPVQRFAGHTDYVNRVRFSSDGQAVFTSSGGDTTVRLWETQTGRELRRFVHLGAEGNFALSPDTKRLITYWSYPNNAKTCASLWDVDTGREVRQFCPSLEVVDFSPDSKSFLVLNSGKPALWSAVTGDLLREYPTIGFIAPRVMDGR